MRRGRLLFCPPPPKVQLHDQIVSNAGAGSGSVTALYRISTDGFVRDQSSHALENWLLSGTTPNSAYDVRATLLSGVVGGTFGTWLNVGGSPSWSDTVGAHGSAAGQFKIEMRDATTLVVLTSAVVSLSVDNGG